VHFISFLGLACVFVSFAVIQEALNDAEAEPDILPRVEVLRTYMQSLGAGASVPAITEKMMKDIGMNRCTTYHKNSIQNIVRNYHVLACNLVQVVACRETSIVNLAKAEPKLEFVLTCFQTMPQNKYVVNNVCFLYICIYMCMHVYMFKSIYNSTCTFDNNNVY
jgi:hypothetical protein